MPIVPRIVSAHWWRMACALAPALLAPAAARADWPSSPLTNVPVCIAPGAAMMRNTASDGQGGLIVAWTDTRSGVADIYAQRMTAAGSGAWASNGVKVCGASNDQDQAFVVSDGSGGAIVAWRDMRAGPTGDLYVQRVTSTGLLAWPAAGVLVCGAANEQAAPVMVPDGFGGAIVVWEDFRSGVAIYAQRVRFDGQLMWAADGVRLATDTAAQFEPVACSDGVGGAIVAWQKQSTGGYDIAAQQVDINGLIRWAESGVTVCAAPGDQVNPQLVPDDAGGAVITWEDYRTGPADIYAQRLNVFGLPYFAANGTPVCDATGDQRWPQLAADGAHGAIITWQDERTGESDVYAQHWSGTTGTRLWAASGAPVVSAVGAQQFPSITRDGSGGAVIAWEDGRSGGSDIYAQRLTANSARMWGTSGLAVCTAPGNQYQPLIAPDQDSVVVLVWSDQRTNGSDLYAQRIPFVVTLDAPPVTNAGVALAASPEPLRTGTELRFDLAASGRVELWIHDASGRRVRRLVAGDFGPGPQRAAWDATDDRGRALPGGVYFARLRVDGRMRATRMLRLLR